MKVDREVLYRHMTNAIWDPSFGKAPAFGHAPDLSHAVASQVVDEQTIAAYRASRQLEAVWKKAYDPKAPIPKEHITDNLVKGDVIQREMEAWTLPSGRADREVFFSARDFLHSVLQPLQDVWGEVLKDCGFGPGAVFHRNGRLSTTILDKVAGESFTITPDAKSLMLDVLQDFYPNWVKVLGAKGRTLRTVRGNKLAFVHKDAARCRGIAVEPSMNMFMQKGVGSYLMKLLQQRCRIDLFEGQSYHRELARHGSDPVLRDLDWRNCVSTIDLQDASDRIPRKLVEFLLPADWFALLDTLRSPESRRPDGSWRVNHAFSTQGNGFTFPLETLVFYALALCGTGGKSGTLSVYGDDIVCPDDHFDRTCQVLSMSGAVVNRDKSYGPQSLFRESCGGDYLSGKDVRPVYYRGDASRPSEIASLHNLLLETWGEAMEPCLEYLKGLVPKDKRLRGPRDFFTSDLKFRALSNKVATTYSSYFWTPPEEMKDMVSYCKKEQTFVYKVREWGYTSPPIPESELSAYDEEGQFLAFLYAGSEYANSPFARPIIRTRKVPVRDL